jgi:hypothetical protein
MAGILSYIGGVILAAIVGLVLKDLFDKAKDLEEAITEVKEAVSKSEALPPQPSKLFSETSSELRKKLRLTRFYGLIRFLHLVRLPKRQNVLAVAELLPKMSGVMQWDSEATKNGFFEARSVILRLLS